MLLYNILKCKICQTIFKVFLKKIKKFFILKNSHFYWHFLHFNYSLRIIFCYLLILNFAYKTKIRTRRILTWKNLIRATLPQKQVFTEL